MGVLVKMNFIKGEKEGEPLLRINTKKYNAVPMKNIKAESAFVVTTAKKSRVKTKIRCEECQDLFHQNDMKRCNSCGKNICLNCAENIKGKSHCGACL